MGKWESFFSKDTQLLKSSEIRDLLKLTEGRNVISFAGGLPDPSTFPVEDIKKITNEILESKSSQALQYTATAGVSELREQLVSFSNLRGISNITQNNIFVSVGSQEALYILFNVLVNPGDHVFVEKPTYLTALNVLRTRRPEFHGVPISERGPDLHEMERQLKNLQSEGKKVKLLYIIPTAQNPAGTTMYMEDRKYVMELASKYDFLVVEDDAYGFLVFDGDNPPPLKALDKEGRVIYLGTFSKILSPGLRLGWIVADEEIIREVELFKQNVDLHTPSFNQFIAAEAIRKGVIQNNLPKVKSLYKEKRNQMLSAMDVYFPSNVKRTRPVGGMFVFVWLPGNLNTTQLLQQAMMQGVAYVPGNSFYYDYSGTNTMRINYSFPSKEEINKGIEILGNLIKSKI
ncbi:PLP-dependent aminotransferase family protein [Metallosphaera tengchongensis]|uniref:PLP-dependent aminotransferase family protein n=1 Tax=Metallosphaera tengchongensis TaxID=1532350 RepID=A0A6N0NX81_9CREN|nr:PLP-dependent aminotransferase family protein [Metallosphaera tengchongensis]QKQ99710.1 PLP-dependent aminotransferase family protein [Metallosphaera tengchongensis]